MEFLIVTGLSGSGKSRVVDALEDIGFYCVDNMPPTLMSKFYELCFQAELEKIAVVTDIRGRELFARLSAELEEMRAAGKKYRLLFMDCEDQTLLNRFKETRRKHPLADKFTSIGLAITAERRMLSPIADCADYLIDTTHLTPSQLKERITQMFCGESSASMVVHILSFGFKYGASTESDLTFDVRCFPNPYYIEQLRPLTGKDKPVRDYVLGCEDVSQFLVRLYDMIDFLMPLYLKEGKSELVVAVGCTGGKHRSVTISEELAKHLTERGSRVVVTHRDIGKTR